MKKIFTVLICLVLLSSCASIIHGKWQDVNFSSSPTGAKIYIDDKDSGNTPRLIPLERKGSYKHGYDVRIELEGFLPYEIKINRKTDGWFWGNILLGGIIGIIIDASNGSMYKLTPDQVVAQMSKSTAMKKSKDDTVYIAVTLTPDSSWTKIGELKTIE